MSERSVIFDECNVALHEEIMFSSLYIYMKVQKSLQNITEIAEDDKKEVC